LLRQRGRSVSANQLRQADRPMGSEPIPNPVGTAPGFAIVVGGCRFVSLPGVPKEFDRMLEQAVLLPLAGERPIARRALYCVGVMEAEVDRLCAGIIPAGSPVRLQFRAKFPEVHVGLHAPPDAESALDAAFAAIHAKLHTFVYSTHETGMGFADYILRECRRHEVTLSVAESCTGGQICNLLTDVPGSSSHFLMGIVAYSYAAKTSWLGVEEATLAEHGAVSEAVVRQMAQGVQKRSSSTFGLSASGISGPDGGLPNKPVGTVWLAVHGPNGTVTDCLHLSHDRLGNKLAAAFGALRLLRQQLNLL
jgi:nicotinamide-nucleotide amidase